MKQLNGTVTLSFLEEDNQQRVIFRVIPLCTREGAAFHGRTAEFPDQGSLRIVPDKREQSTFKERMRGMGCLCSIQLCSEGKELAKVRQNRNYDPGQGEYNQFAIYSDVICEFASEGVFEVFEDGTDFSAALSPRVLLRRGKVLYGPVDRAARADWTTLKPFGNDRYLLHTVEMPGGAQRCFYWDPDRTVNWRQRRGTLRHGKPHLTPDGVEETEPEEAPAVIEYAKRANVETREPVAYAAPAPRVDIEEQHTPSVVLPTAVEPKVEESDGEAAPAPQPAARVREVETALPIGIKLTILDQDITFEEQISKLDQPLSDGANLLARTLLQTSAEDAAGPSRFSGTPLVHMGAKIPQPVRLGETLHNVVEHQVRAAHREPDGFSTDFVHLDNPVENIIDALELAWNAPELQRQALDALCDNEVFTQAFLKQLRYRGREPKAVQAAEEQMADIEAERLHLLMQLDSIRGEDKRARDEIRAGLNPKKREEIAQLEAKMRDAQAELNAAGEALRALGDEVRNKTLEALAADGARLCASDGATVTLSPTIGIRRSPDEMVADVRAALGRQGFACNEDDAAELLLHFALEDTLTITSAAQGGAELCARALVEGLGLASVTAFTGGNTCLRVASLLPENERRTPTVEVGSVGRAGVPSYGHRSIRLMQTAALSSAAVPLPLVVTPALKPNSDPLRAFVPREPVSLESLGALFEDAAPLQPKGEEWLMGLAQAMAGQNAALPETDLQHMRRFIAAASAKLHGGFLAAADAAVVAWVVPVVFAHGPNPETLRTSVESLPRSLSALGLR
ncbi:MAG: hypothetical protein LLF96_05000 [Eubacteriales bacterium]|nr:hypothetical protein [Eubacteriales bacterium]